MLQAIYVYRFWFKLLPFWLPENLIWLSQIWISQIWISLRTKLSFTWLKILPGGFSLSTINSVHTVSIIGTSLNLKLLHRYLDWHRIGPCYLLFVFFNMAHKIRIDLRRSCTTDQTIMRIAVIYISDIRMIKLKFYVSVDHTKSAAKLINRLISPFELMFSGFAFLMEWTETLLVNSML